MGAGEAPRAINDDTDAETLGLARGDAFDTTRLDRDRFVCATHDPDIGIARAALGGRVQGSVCQLRHGRTQPNRVESPVGGSLSLGSARPDPAGLDSVSDSAGQGLSGE